MVKSSFSGKDIPPGKGLMYVKKDGKILYFLNHKEEKNMLKLRRKARSTAWTEEYRKAKGQRMAMAKHAAEHAHGVEKEEPKKAEPKKKPAKKEDKPAKKVSKKPAKKAGKKPAKKTAKK